MGARGTKSSAQLSVVTPLGVERLDPPHELTPDQSVVAAVPADWFDESTLPILTSYCVATVENRRVNDLLSSFQSEWLATDDGMKRYDKLTQLQDRQARLLTSLATKMRLTPQSRYTPKAANTAANRVTKVKPWES